MLKSLHVKNLALIDEIEVEFGEGLNILTGETGAGKSILLGSVNLALGARTAKDMIREGAEYGFVELVFLTENERQTERLKEMEIFPEDGFVVLSRRISDRRSTSRINGETVTMSQLKAAASVLIDIHGQHEHQSLLNRKKHLEIVDAYAEAYTGSLRGQVGAAYRTYRKCREKLDGAEMDEARRRKELDFLEFEASEIRAARLREGEDEELETLYRRMQNARKIADGAAEAYAYTGGEGAGETLGRAARVLSELRPYDDRAAELADQLAELDSLLSDFNRELADYSGSLAFSKEEFYNVESRLNEINRLKTKYGNSVEEILAYCEEQEEKAEKLRDYENYIAGLADACREAESELEACTARLSAIRKDQAEILEKEIAAGLGELNFPDVRFQIHFGELAEYTANGRDDVEFMISLNPGQPIRPLAHVASGGELSRIMLAIRTVMAERDDIETLIFDEIDAGISGRTAQKVSEKMALIGKNHQVICITHLAQIASMADHHYVIEKTVENENTRTQIRAVDGQESVQELARLLGGAKITDAVVKNAVEMKELAAQLKAGR